MLDHDFRRKGIGGSDVAAILKISPWQTPLGLYYYIKCGFRLPDSPTMKAGRDAEKIILDAYEKDYDIIIDRNPQLVDKKYPIFRGNADGINRQKGLLVEAKRAFKRSEWGKPGTTKIPNYYIVQCAYYAAIEDSEKIDIAAQFGFEGKETQEYYRYERNEKLENRLREKVADWWEKHIVQNVIPDPINECDDLNFIKGKIMHAPDSILDLYEKYKKLKPVLEEAQQIKNTIRQWAKKESKGALRVLFPDDSMLGTQVYVEQNTVDKQALKKSGIDLSKIIFKKKKLTWGLN